MEHVYELNPQTSCWIDIDRVHALCDYETVSLYNPYGWLIRGEQLKKLLKTKGWEKHARTLTPLLQCTCNKTHYDAWLQHVKAQTQNPYQLWHLHPHDNYKVNDYPQASTITAITSELPQVRPIQKIRVVGTANKHTAYISMGGQKLAYTYTAPKNQTVHDILETMSTQGQWGLDVDAYNQLTPAHAQVLLALAKRTTEFCGHENSRQVWYFFDEYTNDIYSTLLKLDENKTFKTLDTHTLDALTAWIETNTNTAIDLEQAIKLIRHATLGTP